MHTTVFVLNEDPNDIRMFSDIDIFEMAHNSLGNWFDGVTEIGNFTDGKVYKEVVEPCINDYFVVHDKDVILEDDDELHGIEVYASKNMFFGVYDGLLKRIKTAIDSDRLFKLSKISYFLKDSDFYICYAPHEEIYTIAKFYEEVLSDKDEVRFFITQIFDVHI